MARDVAWSSAARDDYLEIIRYVAERNPDAALRLAKSIDRVAANLADLATGRPGRVTGTFEKMVPASSYIVAYEILRSPSNHAQVVILHVIHGARDWPDEAWPRD